VAKSEIGTVSLNKDTIAKLFNNPKMHIEFDTTSMKRHIPLFEDKLGENVPLKMDLSFKDIDIMFAEHETDIILDYMLCIKFSHDGEEGEEILYDELKVITSIDVEVMKDIAFPHIVSMKLDIDPTYGKPKPTRTSLDLDQRDYRKFLSTFGLSLMEVKTLLNDVVMIDGVTFPFSVDEIFTTVDFLD